MDVGNLISGSFAFSKSNLYIWKSSVHMLLKDFEHNFASMWNECNWNVIWIFFGIAFLWDWNETWPFPGLWPLLSFPNLLHTECRTLIASSFSTISYSYMGFPGAVSGKLIQARILEWVAIPAPGNLPNPGIETVSLPALWSHSLPIEPLGSLSLTTGKVNVIATEGPKLLLSLELSTQGFPNFNRHHLKNKPPLNTPFLLWRSLLGPYIPSRLWPLAATPGRSLIQGLPLS